MKIFKNIFRRKEKQKPQPLRIEGVGEAPMTPEPDDAELAAQALLENMMASASDKNRNNDISKSRNNEKDADAPHDASYYEDLAARIRTAHQMEARFAKRYVAYCEEQLQMTVPSKAELLMLNNLEQGLYAHLDTAEREGGELKRRWQHCVADITVRQMNQYIIADKETT